MDKIIIRKRYLILFLSCLFCGIFNVFPSITNWFKHPAQLILAVGYFCIFLYILYKLWKNERFDEKTVIFLIFLAGFIFRLAYIQSTSHLIRQHDVGGSNGHLAYIMNFYDHKPLPNNVNWQYYQPPVWHYICALFLHIQTTLGIALDAAKENLQLISFFCSSMIMLLSYRLFKYFNLKGIAIIIAFAIVAFHPTFIILSGSINNDVLSIMLTLLSVNLAIKWYREPKLKTILLLALSIGFAMGVKLSAGLISLGVAMLFAIRLFGKAYKNKLNLIGQFVSFGVLCVPIALWWQVRNYIRFDTPFTYVPKLSETNSQYIGFRSTFERLFDISAIWDAGVYPARAISSKVGIYDYYEYNIPSAVLKTSVFGEYYPGQGRFFGNLFANLLFWSAAILAVLSVIAMVSGLIKSFRSRKEKGDFCFSEMLFISISSVVLFISYVKFCFDFAHFCTMDFRYIALTVVFGALYIGLLLKDRQKNNNMFDKIIRISVITLTVVFMISSLALYGTLA